MALINCNECSKEISDQATSCPGCGAPIKSSLVSTSHAKRKTSKTTWIALVLIIIGVFFYTQTRGYKENALPPLPVEVGSRDALMGPGLVLRVKNNSDKTLMLIVTLTNSTTKQEKSFRLDIRPHEFSEIGHAEGWVVANGDTIKLFNENFQTGIWTLN